MFANYSLTDEGFLPETPTGVLSKNTKIMETKPIKSGLTIGNKISLIFEAPKALRGADIINLIKDNAKELQQLFTNESPTFEAVLIKGKKGYCNKFANGQLSFNHNGDGENYITLLNGFSSPEWYNAKEPRYFKDDILFFNDIVKIN